MNRPAVNQFDKIAYLYDALARLVFGRALVKAQVEFLNAIPPHARVLILGGGTGWILDKIEELRKPCTVWYVEASSKMIERSRSRNRKLVTVNFIHGTEQSIPTDLQVDVVITNFYLDLFEEQHLGEIVNKIRQMLQPGAYWLASDFVDLNRWHRAMLWIMYRFFRITTNIEASHLPSWKRQLDERAGKPLKEKSFCGNFIRSVLYSC